MITATATGTVSAVPASESAAAAGGLRGKLSPVNPKHKQVFGQRCYARLRDLPEAPDLAVIVTPARTVPAITARSASSAMPAWRSQRQPWQLTSWPRACGAAARCGPCATARPQDEKVALAL